MTHSTLDTTPAALPADKRPAFGLLTSPCEGAGTVTRDGTARRERASLRSSRPGDIAVHHAALATSGHPPTLTQQADAGAVRRSFVTRKHARRVAWRILKDWIEAQAAIIEAGMATFDDVLLPYMLAPGGQTVYELYADRRLALPAAKGG